MFYHESKGCYVLKTKLCKTAVNNFANPSCLDCEQGECWTLQKRLWKGGNMVSSLENFLVHVILDCFSGGTEMF